MPDLNNLSRILSKIRNRLTFHFIFAFILFRVLDIWKPLWINTAQQLPGGLGIMVDDVLAGIITCIILHVVFII